MSGKQVGYVRVSSLLQNTARQLDGLTLDRTFEGRINGKDMNHGYVNIYPLPTPVKTFKKTA